ncbi:ribosome biosynthesis protein rrb1 [Puccinia graminis f. sp. tritici]|uniref:Ribosome biosynthesis protein rrb1 n=1 Tax=Puccinia graminis f. sp. tritici TaxID=56615 RepID=A0A5B0SN16_PUCGR|nr:ribosome biosynthesis protein rrb1 [Puccinia graminis f. sp. tritici]
MHTTANQNFEKPMRQLDRQDQNTGKGNEGRLNNEGSGKIERSKKNKTAMTKPSGTQGNRKRSLSKSTKRTAAETDGQSPNKSTAVVDKDDLPARLNAVVSLDQAEEGIGEFEDAWEDEFEDEIGSEGHSVHFNPDDEEDENEDEDIIPGDGKELGQDEDDEQDGMGWYSFLYT